METFIHWIINDLSANIFGSIRFEMTRYAIGTLGVWFTIWILFEPLLKSRKIRKPKPRGRQIPKEIWWSFKTVCVFTFMDLIVFDLAETGIFKGYTDIETYEQLYYWISIPIAIILHDAYFYWIHRFMHLSRTYKWFHIQHHRSHNPTPFTAYSFNIAEAVLEYSYVPALLLVMPLHSSAMVIVLFTMIFKNATAHCGYELFPAGTTRHPILKHFTTVTHHDMHHERGTGNFGFYFTWWDKWMGTEHPHYEERFDSVTRSSSKVTA